jgi:hypothetical protein
LYRELASREPVAFTLQASAVSSRSPSYHNGPKKCKRIIKNVSRLLLAQLAEILEEDIGREKKLPEK